MKRVSDSPMGVVTVRLTDRQKREVMARGGSSYVRTLIDLADDLTDKHLEYIESHGGAALLREIVDWEMQCAEKEKAK